MSTSSSTNSNSKDNVFDLESAAFSSDHFRMHEFKVKRCPRARPHDWTQCPFAHPGEKARRRDPRRYTYSGTACPEFRKSGCCRRGDACPFAHGVFECWLHPSRYRTQLCTDGNACKRRVCFFAHTESEIRRPEDDPVVAQRQAQAELAAEVQTLQQQHLASALQALLEATNGQGAPANGNTNGNANGLQTQLPLLTLELLKQTTLPSAASLLGANGTNNGSTGGVDLNLLTQLAAQQQQQQAQPVAQQVPQVQPNAPPTQAPAGIPDAAANTPNGTTPEQASQVQDLMCNLTPDALQQALKQALEQQMKQNSVVEALNQLVGMSAAPDVHISQPGTESIPLPVSVAMMNPTTMAMNGVQEAVQANPLPTAVVPNPMMQMDPMMLSNIAAQNAMAQARMAGAMNRRSIDNSYLANGLDAAIPAVSTPLVMNGSIPPPQNGFNPASQGLADQNMLAAAVASLNPGLMANPAGLPMDQNPALSAQLLQLDSVLLNTLAARSRAAGMGRRSIDNGLLARMNGGALPGMVNGMTNGATNGVTNGVTHAGPPGVPPQGAPGAGPPAVPVAGQTEGPGGDVKADGGGEWNPEQGVPNAAGNDGSGVVSEALLRGLNFEMMKLMEGMNSAGAARMPSFDMAAYQQMPPTVEVDGSSAPMASGGRPLANASTLQ